VQHQAVMELPCCLMLFFSLVPLQREVDNIPMYRGGSSILFFYSLFSLSPKKRLFKIEPQNNFSRKEKTQWQAAKLFTFTKSQLITEPS